MLISDAETFNTRDKTMNLYIDCEWNDWGGELISMALCSEDNQEFYEVLECKHPTKWVVDNVMPILDKDSVDKALFRQSLKMYLSKFKRINIIADWPEDIAHFCYMLIEFPGWIIHTPPLTMEVIRIDAESNVPHNALEDARALRLAIINSRG